MKHAGFGNSASSIDRRMFLRGGLGAGAAALTGALPGGDLLAANEFPSKPLTIVNVFSAGGSYDLLVRMMQPEFEKLVGQPIRQEFIPAASGMLGMAKALHMSDEGYSFAIDAITNFNIITYFSKPKDYTIESFDHLGSFMVEPLVLMARKDSPFNSIDDLLKAAKAGGKAPTVGVTHPKGFYHLVGAIFKDLAKGNVRIVNYAGGGPQRKALVSGEVDCAVTGFFSASGIMSHVKGLMVFADPNPVAGLMKMPTGTEVFGKGTVPNVLHPAVLFVPASVKAKHPERFEMLTKKFDQALKAPATRELAKKLDLPAEGLIHWSPQECAAFSKEFVGTIKKYESVLQT